MNKEAAIDYTSEEFWATAPSGATHWEPESEEFVSGWMKVCNDHNFFWSEDRWVEDNRYYDYDYAEIVINFIPRPTTFTKHVQESPVSNTDWDGTGVPVVGAEFEYNLDSDSPDDWHKAHARYSFDRGVVAMCFVGDRTFEQYLDKDEVQFRPIKKEPTTQEKVLEAWKAQGIDFAYDNEDTNFSFKVLVDFVVNNFDVKEKE